MTINSITQILIFYFLVVLVAKPLGTFMWRVFTGEPTALSPVLRPLERGIYRFTGIDEKEEMPWTTYTISMLVFSLVGLLLSYAMLRLQGILPMNPRGFGSSDMTPDLAFNTAASFTTNTNWQNYVPESTISYLSNMVSLAIHNWMSAATGVAVALALIRGFARRSAIGIGSFWVDVVRCSVYVLFPLALVAAIAYVAMGVPQNFSNYQTATTLEGSTQVIPMGPVASQEAIKQLGTNGGGIFNANSAHPYENPSPASNLLTLVLIFAIPGALTYTFGLMVGNTRQGWTLFAAMSALFLFGALVCTWSEQSGTPHLQNLGIQMTAGPTQSGGNMEGKETRFGITLSTLFAAVTTGASCGAVNSMHDSYTPLGMLVPLFNILSGEVIFGGVGAGLYGMLMLAVIAVFIAGLMVGRTPEYLGKKIEKFEVQMAMLAVLVLAADILFFTAISLNVSFDAASAWNRVGSTATYLGPTTGNLNNNGPRGFSEILYAFTSTTGNNGSALAGLTGNTPYFNLTLGLSMLIGRFLMIIPLVAMAGRLAKKKAVPVSAGTFPTDTAVFVGLLLGVIVIVSALTYFPALALGPVVEHFQMLGMKVQ